MGMGPARPTPEDGPESAPGTSGRARGQGTDAHRCRALGVHARRRPEALRLFPPVWVLPRTAIHADTVSGFPIPQGTEVLISPYLIHRRPDLWSDPEAFWPERFLADRLQPRTPCAFLPFGAGPRSCIGSQPAVIEVVFAVAALAQRCRLTPACRARPRPQPHLSLFPGTTLTMRVHAV